MVTHILKRQTSKKIIMIHYIIASIFSFLIAYMALIYIQVDDRCWIHRISCLGAGIVMAICALFMMHTN